MEAHPRSNDMRKAKRRQEFGPRPVCVLCGETDPVVFHHPCGIANDCWIEGPLCANCHLRAHEELRRYGVDLKHQPRTKLETLENVLRALAVFLRQLAEALLRWAEELADQIQGLNRTQPNWKEAEEVW
jgi:hypothetical protein